MVDKNNFEPKTLAELTAKLKEITERVDALVEKITKVKKEIE